jgi:hypothetical protein
VYVHRYADHVPDQPKTQHRSVRIPDQRWEAADRCARAMGSDRAKLINEYLAWLTREPGARLPKRPPVN